MEIIYHHFKILSSTNDWAKAHLATFSREALTVIWADGQTAGRGQYGRRWISPIGLNLYATFVFLGENVEPLTSTHLLALSALSIFPFVCQIKWPNDLFVHGKKIGGILCEKMASGETVVGIGINVNMPKDQLKVIDQPATSMLEESGQSFSIPYLIQTLAEQFANDLSLYPNLSQEKLKASTLGTTIKSG